METYNFVVSLKNNIIVINNNVDSIQKRYNKYKCSDVFQMMLASSFTKSTPFFVIDIECYNLFCIFFICSALFRGKIIRYHQ